MGRSSSWTWTADDAQVDLIGATTATPTFNADDDGEFDVTLVVCDNIGACSDPERTRPPR